MLRLGVSAGRLAQCMDCHLLNGRGSRAVVLTQYLWMTLTANVRRMTVRDLDVSIYIMIRKKKRKRKEEIVLPYMPFGKEHWLTNSRCGCETLIVMHRMNSLIFVCFPNLVHSSQPSLDSLAAYSGRGRCFTKVDEWCDWAGCSGSSAVKLSSNRVRRNRNTMGAL